ncbi:MAG: hypothetical protein Q4P66_02210 [Actinomycetaceae bacterium]|nr:hypothetical protein [Actinomycetaceae bacterium]
MHEMKYIHLKHKIIDFLWQLATVTFGYAVMIVVIAFAYTVVFGEDFRHGVTLDTVLFYTLSSSMSIGSVVLLSAVIFRHKSISYIIGFTVWAYWNVNSSSTSFLNPFTFIADPNEWQSVVIVQLALFLVMVFFIAFLNTKSPSLSREALNRIRLKIAH